MVYFKFGIYHFSALPRSHHNVRVAQNKRFLFSKIFRSKKSNEENKPYLDICSRVETPNMSLPVLGLGTWQSGPKEVRAAVRHAIEIGYKHVDTAFMFGNECHIGYELTKLFDTGLIYREELFITSKLPHYAMTPESVPTYLRKSLDDLQLSYVDLYLINFPAGVLKDPETQLEYPDPNTCLTSVWQAMENQVFAGYAKNIGLSNVNIEQINRILSMARIPPANVQVEMHLYCQQKEMLSFCKANNITLCAYAPLGSPALSIFVGDSSGKRRSCKVLTPLTDPIVAEIAAGKKLLPSQILLRHLLQHGVAVIPKSVKLNRIQKNSEVFQFSLSNCEMELLNSLDRGNYGRMFHANIWKGLENHPEYPFKC